MSHNSIKRTLYYVVLTILITVCLCVSIFNVVILIEKKLLYPLKFKNEIITHCEKFDLDPLLICAIINTESSFNPSAKSKKGANGLMQLTDDTAKYISEMTNISDYDLLSPDTNIYFGCFYLRYLLNKFKNQKTALAAYNAGEGNVKLWLNNPEYSNDKSTLSLIPFPETREYLKKIYKSLEKYRKLYGNLLDKHT